MSAAHLQIVIAEEIGEVVGDLDARVIGGDGEEPLLSEPSRVVDHDGGKVFALPETGPLLERVLEADLVELVRSDEAGIADHDGVRRVRLQVRAVLGRRLHRARDAARGREEILAGEVAEVVADGERIGRIQLNVDFSQDRGIVEKLRRVPFLIGEAIDAADDLTVDGGVADSRDVPVESNRHGAIESLTVDGEEEVGLVLDDGSAEASAELLLRELGVGQIVAVAVLERRAKGLVPAEEERASAKIVRSRLRHHVEEPSTGAPELRGVAVCENLELLHRFLGYDEVRNFRLAGGRAEEGIVEVGAVDGDVGIDALHAAHVDGGSPAGGAGHHDVRRVQGEVLVVATGDGEVLDLPRVEGRRGNRPRDLDEGRLRGHRDGFFHRRDFDGQVPEALLLTDVQHEPVPPKRLEPGEVRGQHVPTDGKERHPEAPVLVGHDGS